MTISQCRIISLVACALSVSCGSEIDAPLVGVRSETRAVASSEWSAPVNVGAPVNSLADDLNAALSPDELSLYFTSNRPGGLGATDIWVSRRACDTCPWTTPVNLGAPVNAPGVTGGPRLSRDGHLLFFQSDRSGGQGALDIYVSRRDDPKDDFDWDAPVGLGTGVNTAASDAGADYLQSAERGAANLYFNRGTFTSSDLYSAAVNRDGRTRGPVVLVSELSDPTAGDQHASVRHDGREIFFSSNRVGGLGGGDLWTSTRRSVGERWSPPVNPGALLNSAANDQQPTLSSSGRTLLFTSDRPGGLGGLDLWISTRMSSRP